MTTGKKKNSVKKAAAAAVARAVNKGRSRSTSRVRFNSRSRSRSKPRAPSKKKEKKVMKESHKGSNYRQPFLPLGKKSHTIHRKSNTDGSLTMSCIVDLGQFRVGSTYGNDPANAVSWLSTLTPNMANTEMGNEAQNWEKFYFKEAEITFCNTLGSNTTGAITGFFDSDPLAVYTIGLPSDYNAQLAVSHSGHKTTALNTTCTWRLGSKKDKKIVYYCRNNPGDQTQARVTYPGKFVVVNMVDLPTTNTVFGVYLLKLTVTFFERSLSTGSAASEAASVQITSAITPALSFPVNDRNLQKRLVSTKIGGQRTEIAIPGREDKPNASIFNYIYNSVMGGLKAIIYAALGGATTGITSAISQGESKSNFTGVYTNSNNCIMTLAPGSYEIDLQLMYDSGVGKYIYFDGNADQLNASGPFTGYNVPFPDVLRPVAGFTLAASTGMSASLITHNEYCFTTNGAVLAGNSLVNMKPLAYSTLGGGYNPYYMPPSTIVSVGTGIGGETNSGGTPISPVNFNGVNMVMMRYGVLPFKFYVNVPEVAVNWASGEGTGSNTETLVGTSPQSYVTSNNSMNQTGIFDLNVTLSCAASDTTFQWTKTTGNIVNGSYVLAGGPSIAFIGSKWSVRQIDGANQLSNVSPTFGASVDPQSVTMIQFPDLPAALKAGYDESYVYPNSGPALTVEQSKKLLSDRDSRLNPITSDEEKLLATINKLFGRASELPVKLGESVSSPPIQRKSTLPLITKPFLDPVSTPILDPMSANPYTDVKKILSWNDCILSVKKNTTDRLCTVVFYACDDNSELHYLTSAHGTCFAAAKAEASKALLLFWSSQEKSVDELQLWPNLEVDSDTGLVGLGVSRTGSKKKKSNVTMTVRSALQRDPNTSSDDAE